MHIQRHPDRVLNVGIREQLMVSVAGGLALTGLRPIAHSYTPFLVERAWEQMKLDLGHQGVGAILVSVGASYDASTAGRTHHGPGMWRCWTRWTAGLSRCPDTRDEVEPMLRVAARHDRPVYVRLAEDHNERPHATHGRLALIRPGQRGLVVAVGPMLAPTLAATEGLDLAVAYSNTPRPWDAEGTRELVWPLTTPPLVVLVEPYLAGTSAHVVSSALTDVPHRLLSLGVTRTDSHRYGERADHQRLHGLDPAGLRASITKALPG